MENMIVYSKEFIKIATDKLEEKRIAVVGVKELKRKSGNVYRLELLNYDDIPF